MVVVRARHARAELKIKNWTLFESYVIALDHRQEA
jgi:hypothetical protein